MSILVHCLNKDDRADVIKNARSKNLQVHIPHISNPHAVQISGDSKTVEDFAKTHEKKNAVFYGHEHPKAGKNKYKPHFRRHVHPKVADSGITAKTSGYGNTCTYLKEFYNFPAQNGSAPTIAIISLGGNYKPTDLVYYWQSVLGYSSWAKVMNVSVDGASYSFTGGDADTENTLDLEICGGMCPSANIIFYSAPNTDQGFYDAVNQAMEGSTINGTFYKPSIISISWGSAELYYETTMMTAFDQLFSLGNSQGVTTCVAAGDNGSTDGIAGSTPHLDFPSSSPNVTSCGGTSVKTAPETTWSYNASYGWGTGGGVSSFFAQPSYQVGVVTYPTSTACSIPTGKRASPDIAMNADPLSGWTIFFNGGIEVNGAGGTSCVAPAMSGLLGLMNLKYATSFNTCLYNAYKNISDRYMCFKDITTGTNDSLSGSASTGVYKAGTGYDCCTGLGAPNGVNLFNALQTGI